MKFTKEDIFTIPNILSFLRILMIPGIVVLYCVYQEYAWATALIVLSGITDVVDGRIARTFNMVSDFGKMLDPVADKLTQVAVVLCLSLRYPYMIWMFVLMFVKEMIMGITGLLSIKYSGSVHAADWHGKIVTVLLYGMMVLHLVWFDIPMEVSNIVLLICAVMMIISLALYTLHNVRRIQENKKKKDI